MEIPRLAEGATVRPTLTSPLILTDRDSGEEAVVNAGEMNKNVASFNIEQQPGESTEDLARRIKARIQIWLDEEPRSKPERDCD